LLGNAAHQHFAEQRVPNVGSAGEFATDAELALANWDCTASSVKQMTFIALKTTEA
jgi:hypothetical protein